MSDIYPVLWLKQIPNFIIAYHDRGKFDDVPKKDVSAEIKKWEAAHANELRKFVILIRKIVEYTREMAGTKLEVYRPPVSGLLAEDELQIREQADGGVNILPSDLKEEWILATTKSDLPRVSSSLAQIHLYNTCCSKHSFQVVINVLMYFSLTYIH